MKYRALISLVTAAALTLLAGCPPSAARVQAARTTHYAGNPPELISLAEAAAVDQQYKIEGERPEDGVFMTAGKWYGIEGDVRTQGAGGASVEDGAIFLQMIVRLVGSANDATVEIIPVMQRHRTGSPILDKVQPGDPSAPAWVQGKVDGLYVAINEALAGHVAATPP